MSTTKTARTETITERGMTFVSLTSSQAARLQALNFCRVSPTQDIGLWRISDVTRVGIVAIDDVRFLVQPKTPLRSLIFMASYTGQQAVVGEATFDFEADQDLPVALAESLIRTVTAATERGLLKGYVSFEESSTVVRGRWDIARQLKNRPGIPLPVELTYDDFTEDVMENRLLRAALRALMRVEQLPSAIIDRLGSLLTLFADVSDLRGGAPVASPISSRLNMHYAPALRIAQWILEATSWAHAAGGNSGGTFLLNVARVYEDFIGNALRTALRPQGVEVDLQVTDWRLDAGGAIRLKPDIVLSRGGDIVTIADTKYKVWGDSVGSPPNSDVYQALAYAVTADVREAHLLYVSGDVAPRRYEITATGTTVVAHAMDLSGHPDDLLARVEDLGRSILGITPVDAVVSPAIRGEFSKPH